MTLLEEAADESVSCMTLRLVVTQYAHALRAVEVARRLEDVHYGR